MKPFARRWAAFAVMPVLVGAALFGVACGSSDDDDAGGEQERVAEGVHASSNPEVADAAGGTVRIRLDSDFDSLDPARYGTTQSQTMVIALYDRLIALTPDGKLKPWLASSWKTKPNGVSLTIRDGATCGDGTPVTAEVVAASLRRLGAPETAAPNGAFTFGPAGSTVTARGNQVTVVTKQPWHDLLRSLAMPWSGIVCPAGLEDQEALNAKSFGSGPYELTEAQRGRRYVLTARKDYDWGPEGLSTSDAGFPAQLIFQVVPNDTTAANLFQRRELDAGYVLSQDFRRLAADEELWHLQVVKLANTFLIFNQDKGRAGADPVVRKAFAMAVDPKAYIRAAAFGEGVTATSVVGTTMPCYDKGTKELVPAFDPKAAKELLLSKGWSEGGDGKLVKNGKRLTVLITGASIQNSGPEYLQTALNEIGADAKVRTLDVNSWVQTLLSGEYDVTGLGTGPPPLSPMAAVVQVAGPAPPAGLNFARNPDPGVAQAMGQAEAASSDADACSAWAKAQRALIETSAVRPLMTQRINYFGNQVKFDVVNGLTLDALTIRKTK
jgi:peptide/nickel transport system substrate-binding protein